MADKKLEKWLAEADRAYARRDKRNGAKLIDDILKQDFNHAGAWTLLHRLFGSGRDFEEFRRAFTLQYYPDKTSLLQPIQNTGQSAPAGGDWAEALGEPDAPPEKKPGFFARLFSIFRRKPKPVADEAPASSEPPSRPRPVILSQPASKPVSGATSTISGTPLASAHAPSRPLPSSMSMPPPADRLAAPAPTQAPSQTPSLGLRRPSETPVQTASSGMRKIQVVVVDDIPQTRETVIRTLRFQEEIDVIGTASNGLQAIQLVKELRPDVVVMDVNMPDMDGITATAHIKREVPHAQVIILTVQDDVDYIRQAMNAGARDFLAKPPMIEELIAAVHRAGEFAHRERDAAPQPMLAMATGSGSSFQGSRADGGKIITVYSPRGGVGCTTLACNLAGALHNDENHVIVIDAALQFGDVAAFFNLQPKNDILDLTPRVDEIDQELLDNVLTTHTSGIQILPPSRPERSELVTGPQFNQLLEYLRPLYAYIIIDTPRRLSDVTLAALDTSDLIILIATQDIPSIARMRKFLDLAPLLKLDPRRFMVVMNQYDQRISIDPEKVGQAFNHKISAVIPAAMDIALNAANRGEPFMLQKDMAAKPIGRGVLSTIEAMRAQMLELEQNP